MRKRIRQRFGVWLRAQLPGHTPAVRSTKEGWLLCPCGRYGFEQSVAAHERAAAEADNLMWCCPGCGWFGDMGYINNDEPCPGCGGDLPKEPTHLLVPLDRVRGDGPETEEKEGTQMPDEHGFGRDADGNSYEEIRFAAQSVDDDAPRVYVRRATRRASVNPPPPLDAELLAIVREIAARDSEVFVYGGADECMYCHADVVVMGDDAVGAEGSYVKHDPDCLVMRARKTIERATASPTTGEE